MFTYKFDSLIGIKLVLVLVCGLLKWSWKPSGFESARLKKHNAFQWVTASTSYIMNSTSHCFVWFKNPIVPFFVLGLAGAVRRSVRLYRREQLIFRLLSFHWDSWLGPPVIRLGPRLQAATAQHCIRSHAAHADPHKLALTPCGMKAGILRRG